MRNSKTLSSSSNAAPAIRVVIADDVALLRQTLENLLTGWGYKVTVCCDGDEAWDALRRESGPTIALLDWIMPGIDGLDLCQLIHDKLKDSSIYTILLTARNREEDVVTGLDAGADAYITKPFNADDLKARVRTAERILNTHQELLQRQSALRRQIAHDTQVEAWNHSAILEILQREVERANGQSNGTSAIVAAIDRQPGMNGALYDVVLQRLRKCLRPYDSIGRCKDDEFLIVLPDCDTNLAGILAERLHRAVTDAPVATATGNISLRLSAGAATIVGAAHSYGAKTSDAPLQVVVDATRAMQQVRQSSGNGVMLHRDETSDCMAA